MYKKLLDFLAVAAILILIWATIDVAWPATGSEQGVAVSGLGGRPYTAVDVVNVYKTGSEMDKLAANMHIQGIINGALATQLLIYEEKDPQLGFVKFMATCPVKLTSEVAILHIAAREKIRNEPLQHSIPYVIHITCHSKDVQS